MDFSTMTPPQIDAMFADIAERREKAHRTLTSAVDMAHRAAGERPVKATKNGYYWRTTAEEALTACAQLLADGFTASPISMRDPAAAITKHAAARTELDRLGGEQAPLTEEWNRRGGWSRFFLVDKGHIHRSQACSTCRVTTKFGWLPELSGLTEADAVNSYGPLLCSVCFPSAPVEWTVGKPKREYCAGGNADKPFRQGMRFYGTCPTCDEVHLVVGGNQLRKHAPKKTAPAAAIVEPVTRTETPAEAALAQLVDDGVDLRAVDPAAVLNLMAKDEAAVTDPAEDETFPIEINVEASRRTETVDMSVARWEAMTVAERLQWLEDAVDQAVNDAGGAGYTLPRDREKDIEAPEGSGVVYKTAATVQEERRFQWRGDARNPVIIDEVAEALSGTRHDDQLVYDLMRQAARAVAPVPPRSSLASALTSADAEVSMIHLGEADELRLLWLTVSGSYFSGNVHDLAAFVADHLDDDEESVVDVSVLGDKGPCRARLVVDSTSEKVLVVVECPEYYDPQGVAGK